MLAALLALAIAFASPAMHQDAHAEEMAQPRARIINVAYDDSGSMDNNKKAWCQAHYALEVFANMLGENDVLNVFTMSDAESGKTAPCLTIYGSDSAKARVDQAHTIFSQRNSSTPYDVVVNAKNHLNGQNADAEHWLVILTDGAFTEYKGKDYSKNKTKLSGIIEADLRSWADDGTKIEYLALGSDASSNLPSDSQGMNVYAIGDAEILDGIVSECKTIFGMAPLEGDYLDSETGTLKIDIPMKRFVVFAQGQNTNVGGMELEDGTVLDAAELSHVRYVEKPHREETSISKRAVVDRTLQGTVATFVKQGGFEPGKATVDVTNAENVTVYYEPYVDLETSFTSKGGKTVKVVSGDDLNLKAGTYAVSYRLLNPYTGEEVDSPLITSSECSANLEYEDGSVTPLAEGKSVKIKEGDGVLRTSALINGDVELRQEAAMSVMPKNLEVEVLSAPKQAIPVKKLDSSDPIQLKVTKSGKDLNAEDWEKTSISVSTTAAKDYVFPFSLFKQDTGLDCEVMKGDAPGTYNVYLKQHNGDPVTTVEGSVPLALTATYDAGFGKSFGEGETSVTIEGLSLLEKITSWVLRHLLLLLLLLLILILLAMFIMWLRKPRLPYISPELVLERNHREDLVYNGKIINKHFPPWAPQKTSFYVEISGVPGDPLELSRRFPLANQEIVLIAEKEQSGIRCFRIAEETIAMMKSHMADDSEGPRSRRRTMATTGMHPNPKYSCVGEGMDKFMGPGGQISFKGYAKNRRGEFADIKTYRINLG